jgi:hypothetical protein
MPAPESLEPSLYERVMGADFAAVAPALQRFHRLAGRHALLGVVETEPPPSWLGRLLARGLGSPLQATTGAIRFELDAAPTRETWTRHFPSRTMRSRLRFDAGRVTEHMGLARMTFTLEAIDGRLHMRLQRLRFGGVSCPAWLRPRIVAEETGEGDRLHFRIEARVPGLGRVVGYRGHLVVPGEPAA